MEVLQLIAVVLFLDLWILILLNYAIQMIYIAFQG